MTKQEEHELRLIGFSEDEIQEMKKAQVSAKADMKGKKQNNAKKNRTDN